MKSQLQEESSSQFEKRKLDHIRLSLDERNQALGRSGLNGLMLVHEALPDLNFEEIEIGSPFYLSSMTAGHKDSLKLNHLMAEVCSARGWAMGVGSQRKELSDLGAGDEWRQIRKSVPNVKLMGNIGISQLIHTPVSRIRDLADNLQATAMIVHLNALQECLQPEGTPQFKGGLKAIENLVRELGLPVVIKETGCGFSAPTLQKLNEVGVHAVDISGLGGTHWGRIEGGRSESGSIQSQAAETFKDWGIATVESLLLAKELDPQFEIWASGGVRSGLDAAILLAMGAKSIGFAKPLLEAALISEQALNKKMECFEFELKTALFCTGCKTTEDLQRKNVWQWRKI